MVSVVPLLKQAIAASVHLHSLGILHRDLRAANVPIASLDPLQAVVVDFGVSHLFSAFASGTSSKIEAALTCGAAVGPLLVSVSVQVFVGQVSSELHASMA
jgi:serine/threonine protein kinase